MNGYSLSTPSSLDRKSRINNFFSGSVFLDRIHDSIGSERLRLSIKNNIANIRFTTPNDFFIRPNYYLILPDGDVKEYKFDSLLVGQNNFLKQ